MNNTTMAEEGVDEVHRIVYRRVLPVLVILGICANTLCLLVLNRPALRAMKVTWYFVALASCDILICFCYIIIVTTISGCTFSSYIEAFYFTHFGWTLVGVCRTFSSYIMAWLSFDRFVAVWKYDKYPRLQQHPHVKRNRLTVSVVLSVAFHILYMVRVHLSCDSQVEGDEYCEHGRWISISGYHYDSPHVWHKVYKIFYSVCARWLPGCLIAFFNASLIVGVIQGRVHLPRCRQASERTWERNLVIVTIAITICYFLTTIPITVYIVRYAKAVENRCSSNHPYEVFGAIATSVLLFDHVFHIVIHIGFNSHFRKELKYLLRLGKAEEEGTELSGTGATSLDDTEKTTVEAGKRTEMEKPRASPSLHSTKPSHPTPS